MEAQSLTAQEQLSGLTEATAAALSSRADAASPISPLSQSSVDLSALSVVSSDLALVMSSIQMLDTKLEGIKGLQLLPQSSPTADSKRLVGFPSQEEEDERRQQKQMLTQLQTSLDSMQAALKDIASQVTADSKEPPAVFPLLGPSLESEAPSEGQAGSASYSVVKDSLPMDQYQSLAASQEDTLPSPDPAGDYFPQPHSQVAGDNREKAFSLDRFSQSTSPTEAPEASARPNPMINPFQPSTSAEVSNELPPQQQQQQQQGQQEEWTATADSSALYSPRDLSGMGLSDVVSEALRLLRLGREEARLGKVINVWLSQFTWKTMCHTGGRIIPVSTGILLPTVACVPTVLLLAPGPGPGRPGDPRIHHRSPGRPDLRPGGPQGAGQPG